MNKSLLNSLLLLLFFTIQAKASSLDSLRLETSNGVNFVIHQVTKGQTLYSTLKKYGSNLADYKKYNPDAAMEIQTDQLLRIPYFKAIKGAKGTKKAKVEKDVTLSQAADNEGVNDYETTKGAPTTFKVEPGMTLFAVAKRNGVSVAELKRLNNMKSDVIQVGQVLIVKEGKTIQIPKGKEQVIANRKTDRKEEELPREKVIVKEEIVEAPKPKAEPVEERVVVEKPKPVAPKPQLKVVESPVEPTKAVIAKADMPVEAVKTSEEIDENTERKVRVEEGVAELIEVESKSGKYLALHKSAPLGTLVQVKNETTGASVWVKVIGRLPEVDQNQNVIIKLSPKAMNRVSPIDKRFRAKINYSM
jgi:LysM repeat protein